MTWLLCDYGEVLSHAQPESNKQLLQKACGRSADDTFWADYWEHRPEYDQGTTPVSDYWSAVLHRTPDNKELSELIAEDIASWLHFNPASLAAVERARARGFQLAILSNAPHEVANAIDGATELSAFSPRLFSCRFGVNKPDPGIYIATLAALGATPEGVIFLDDRIDNVRAAQAVGIKAQLFTKPEQIDAIELF